MQPNHKPYTIEMKLKVAHELEDAGLTETAVGNPATLESHRVLCKALRDDGIKMRLSGHSQVVHTFDWKGELERVAEAGVDIVWMVFPGTEPGILSLKEQGVNISKEHMTDDYCKFGRTVVEYAKRLGLIASPGLDLGAPLDRVASFCKAIAEAGANRVFVFDSHGVYTPETIKFYVRFVKGVIGPDVKIAVHCHNDYGLANINTIAAVTAGSEVIDVSVNGLGHRAGIGALEGVVPQLEVLYGVDTGVKMEKLQHLSDFVEEVYGIKMQQHYPIVGDSMWVHEGDAHNAGVLRARASGEPDAWAEYNIINPEVFGAKEKLQFGLITLHKGPQSCLAIKIGQMGRSATDKQFDELCARILEISEKKNHATEEEVERLIEEILRS